LRFKIKYKYLLEGGGEGIGKKVVKGGGGGE
jgi:hypothetical protein